MTYFKLKSGTQCLLVEKFLDKSVVGRDSWDVVGLTLESGDGRLVAALEASVWLVLIGQQVAPNSQDESGERYVVFRFHLGLG